MRIALLTDGIYPFVVGGMQKHSYLLCKYLAKNNIQVTLFHPDICTIPELLSGFTDEEQRNINCILVKMPVVPAFPGHYLYQGYLYSKNIARHVELLNSMNFIYSKGRCAFYLLKKRKLFTAPIGSNNHGYEFFQKQVDTKSFLQSLMLRRAFGYINKKADFVFSYGGKISKLLQDKGVPYSKIIEIPGAVEADIITSHEIITTGVRKFLFIGRYEKRKGIELINKCIKELSSDYNFEFHFIGNIPVDLQLAVPNVKYHGMIKNSTEVLEIIDRFHVLVCPSYSEGMPNVILEAMAGGCAVIASDVGAVSLAVDETVGWLIEPGSSDSLKSALIRAIEFDNDDLTGMRLHARSVIKKKFTWNTIINTTINKIQAEVKKNLITTVN